MTSSASEELTSCDFCWEPLYFPLHSQCLLIAKRVIQNRCNKSVELGVDSLDRLYEVLEGRYNAREELEGHKAPFCWLPEPNDYLGVGDDFEPLAYEQEKVQEYIQSPIEIPSLREYLTSRLQSLPYVMDNQQVFLSPSPKSSTSDVNNLPPEIINLVFEQLSPLEDTALECTRLAHSSLWRQALTEGHLIPWLWDLKDAFEHMELANADGDREWDWELLARQLAHREAFEPGGPMEGAPPGLRNRRRIWRLVEEMRVGDVETPDPYNDVRKGPRFVRRYS